MRSGELNEEFMSLVSLEYPLEEIETALLRSEDPNGIFKILVKCS